VKGIGGGVEFPVGDVGIGTGVELDSVQPQVWHELLRAFVSLQNATRTEEVLPIPSHPRGPTGRFGTRLPPPHKGPPWTTVGAFFLALRGGILFVHPFLPFSLHFPNKGGDFYLDRFFRGSGGGLLFGHGTNKEGGPLSGGLPPLPFLPSRVNQNY